MRGGKRGAHHERLAVAGHRLVEPAGLLQQERQVVERLGALGLQRERPAIGAFRAHPLAGCGEDVGGEAPRRGRGRIERGRGLDLGARLGEAAEREERLRAVVQQRGSGSAQRARAIEPFEPFLRPSLRAQRRAEELQGLDQRRRGGGELAQRALGLGQAAGLEERHGARVRFRGPLAARIDHFRKKR